MKSFTSFTLILFTAVGSQAFCPVSQQNARPSTAIFDGDGTGGWGIGGQRELTPEEFVKGDRSYFEGYMPQQQGDFMNQLRQDQETLEKSQMEELLGVAKAAGLKIKDPSERLNKFEPDVFDQDDDDELDVSV